MRPVTLQDMRQHVVLLCAEWEEISIEWRCRRSSQAWAARDLNLIHIPPIRSVITYATALHEIGHIRGRHQNSRYSITRERWAWRWAKKNALLWTPRMEKDMRRALTWCEATRGPFHPGPTTQMRGPNIRYSHLRCPSQSSERRVAVPVADPNPKLFTAWSRPTSRAQDSGCVLKRNGTHQRVWCQQDLLGQSASWPMWRSSLYWASQAIRTFLQWNSTQQTMLKNCCAPRCAILISASRRGAIFSTESPLGPRSVLANSDL
jgi:hypothetical protein